MFNCSIFVSDPRFLLWDLSPSGASRLQQQKANVKFHETFDVMGGSESAKYDGIGVQSPRTCAAEEKLFIDYAHGLNWTYVICLFVSCNIVSV